MMKKIVSILLCLCMMVGLAFAMTGCGDETTTDTTKTLPATINFIGITEEETTPEAIEAMAEAFNRLAKNRYTTKVNFTFVTADEYINLVEARFAEAEQQAIDLAARIQYNNYAIRQAQKREKLLSSSQKSLSRWTKQVSSVIAETLSTGALYTAEETTIYDDGRIETLYPDPNSPVDILMIQGKEMYDYLDAKGYLRSVEKNLEISAYANFYQYIYPTFFTELKAITGDIKAIPNNNLLAEYTYLVVDKELADEYDLDVDNVDAYEDLADFLAQVKAGESGVVPMGTVPDALGIYSFFDGDIAVGTYFDPIYGYNTEEGTDFVIRNLFDIPQYRAHLELMETYRNAGYFGEGEKAAVNVIRGDARIAAEYADTCYVKVLQNPFIEEEAIFGGMLAISSCSSDSDAKRALNIIQMITTDSEAKNILQYGIEFNGKNEDVANYRVVSEKNEDGTYTESIERLNHNYMMDTSLTGNVYMGYPEEGQNPAAWTYYKQTNLEATLSPFLHFYLSGADFDDMLEDIVRRAAMTEILAKSGIDYDEYEESFGMPNGTSLRRTFKADNIEYLMGFLYDEKLERTPLNGIIKQSGSSAALEDFLTFAASKEGLAIMKAAGYMVDPEAAPSYQPKAGLSGEVKLGAYVSGASFAIFKTATVGLAEAYMKLNSGVTVTAPQTHLVNSSEVFNDNSDSVVSGEYDMVFVQRAIQSVETGKGLKAVSIAEEVMTVYNNDLHKTYSLEWFENHYIDEYRAAHFADIVSPTQLATLVSEKLASLAGTTVAKFNESVKNADKYITYIGYLRVMARLFLYDEMSEEEWDALNGSLTDAAFETMVFDRVKQKYEDENAITEEAYDKLIKDLMTSVLYFYDENNQTTDEPVSWDEFQSAKAEAAIYMETANIIRGQYAEELAKKYPESYLSLLDLPDIMEEVYAIMYADYLKEQGLTKTEFENSVKDIYLTKVGTTAEEFATYKKSSDEYKAYVAKLRSEYKKLLIEEFSSDAYKKGESGISNDAVLSTLFSHFLEEQLNLHEKMAEIGRMSYAEFTEMQTQYENYITYLNTMKTSFLYTLRTRYTQSQIDRWTNEETEANVYSTLYEVGFYTNEMAKYVGLELRDYMLAKSKAVTYQGYVAKLVEALSEEIKALGYDPATFKDEESDLVIAVCNEIIEEKFFSEKVSVTEVLEAASGDYVRGIADASKSGAISAYFDEASAVLKEDSFFTAVVNELQAVKKGK